MDYYFFLKFLHVLLIIIWLGGGFCLVLLATRAERARDDAELVHIVRQVIFMTKVFIPAAFAALLLGLVMVRLTWSFTDLWVIIGLIGFAATVATGILVLKPRADRIGALFAAEGVSPRVAAQSRALLAVAKFDFVMLFLVAADMVLKPAPGSTITLAAMALCLAAGAVLFLGRRAT